MFDTDTTYFSYSVDATLHGEGIEQDGDGYEVDWDAIDTVDGSDLPPRYQRLFDAEAFYSIPTTVARPILQDYRFGDDTYTFLKPAEELAKSAWSLDNKPWTLTHPETGAVRSYDQIHGAWTDPEWDDENENLDATLIFPTTDDEGKTFIEDSGDVSVGFTNRLDADVSVDHASAGVDAYQRDLYYDHVASVKVGRCPAEEGCGLHIDGVETTARMMHAEEVSRADGSLIESPDGDLDSDSTTTTMCQNGFDLDSLNDLRVERIRMEHDGIDSALAEKDERIEELESELADAKETTEGIEDLPDHTSLEDAASAITRLVELMDLDDEESLMEAINKMWDDYESAVEVRQEIREEERAELESFLADKAGVEVTEDDDLDDLREKKELVESVLESTDSSVTTASPTNDTGEDNDAPDVSGASVVDPRSYAAE